MTDRKVSKLQSRTLDALTEEFNALINGLGDVGLILHYDEHATADLITTADATDATTGNALANELKADFNTHLASTKRHAAADATNVTSTADATDAATLQALVNAWKADFNAHQLLTTSHRGAGGQGSPSPAPTVISTADATDAATQLVLVNAGKAAFNMHVKSGAQALDRDGT